MFFNHISHSRQFTFNENQACLSLPLIGVDHELVEVGVVLDDALRNHLDDVLVAVLQLVQFQIDSEQILPDSVRTGFQSATHHVPAGQVPHTKEGQPSFFSVTSGEVRDPLSHLSELAGLLVTGLKRETLSKQRYSR